MAFHHDGFFQAMDTYREYKQLNEIWASGEAPWKNHVLEPPAFFADLSRLQAELKKSDRVEDPILTVHS